MNGRRCFAALSIFCLLTAASAWGQGATTSVYGKWRIDQQETREATRAKSPSVDVPVDVDVDITVEFGRNGKLSLTYQQKEEGAEVHQQRGVWEVQSEGRGRLKVELSIFGEDDAAPEKTLVEIHLVDAQTMQIHLTEEKHVLVMKRLSK
ncbi:MAG: hypothetical protein RIC55_21990 [Pirellulaceae bacterium]